MATDLRTFPLLLALVPAVWALLALSDRWLGGRGPRVWHGYHFRLKEGRSSGVDASRRGTVKFRLIAMAPKPRTKRSA